MVKFNEDKLSSITRDVNSALLKGIRVACRQWWIGQPYAVFADDLQNVFSIDRFGMQVDNFYGTYQGRIFGRFEDHINNDTFQYCFDAAISGKNLPMIDEIFMDGVLEEMRWGFTKSYT